MSSARRLRKNRNDPSLRRRSRRAWLQGLWLEDRTAPAVYDVTTVADVVNATDGVLSLREAVLAANASVGVFVSGTGALTVLNTTLSNNSGSNGGGIIVSTGGTLTVRGSTITANTALLGGGILSSGATTQIENCTIDGNTGSENGGGIYV